MSLKPSQVMCFSNMYTLRENGNKIHQTLMIPSTQT